MGEFSVLYVNKESKKSYKLFSIWMFISLNPKKRLFFKNSFPVLLRCIWHTWLYKFKVYSIMILHILLWNDYYSKFSIHHLHIETKKKKKRNWKFFALWWDLLEFTLLTFKYISYRRVNCSYHAVYYNPSTCLSYKWKF